MQKEIKKPKKKQVTGSFAGIPVKRLGPVFALLGALLYIQTITFDFTQDDAIVISDNMYTTEGISGIPGLLGHDTFYGYFKDANKTRLVSGGRYRPLTPVMFAIEREIAGPDPWFHHLMNAVFYGLLCWIVFGFTREFLSARVETKLALRIALITALIFAIHPIHTEAVANIKGRDEIAAAMASLGGLWLMIRSLHHKNPWMLRGIALFVFLLGLLAKENVITMLAVVPLTLWWHAKNKKVEWFPGLIPIVIACGIFLVIRASVTGLKTGDPPMELMNNPFHQN